MALETNKKSTYFVVSNVYIPYQDAVVLIHASLIIIPDGGAKTCPIFGGKKEE